MTTCAPTSSRATIFCMRLYQRDNGIWYVRKGRSGWKSLGTKDEKVARAALKRLEKEDLEARLFTLDKSGITLDQWKTEYLSGRGHLSPNTTRVDEIALRLLGDVIGHNTPIRAITKARLDEFQNVSLARGLSKGALAVYQRHIRAALNAAGALDYLEKVPQVKEVKRPQKLKKLLSPEESARLIAHAREVDPDMARIIQFALYTGCRRAEILGLRWEHIKNGVAYITGKGEKERAVPLLPGALEAMGEIKHIGPVFRQFHPDVVTHRFATLAASVGLTDVTPHSLRHSAATQMLSSGIPLPVVQEILGHAQISTTQIYARVLEEYLKKEMQKLKWEM